MIDSLKKVIANVEAKCGGEPCDADTARINAYGIWGNQIYIQNPDSAIILWQEAERIALELKDRACRLVDQEEITPQPVLEGEEKGFVDDALSALLNLGYSPKAANMAVEKARSQANEMTLEEFIREALKVLA